MSEVGDGDRGATLLEMLVVLGILGLIGSLSAVQLRHTLDLYALRAAEGSVQAAVKVARSQALRSGAPVAFSAAGSTYAWDGSIAHSVPSGVALSASGPIVLYPDGTSSGGTITLSNTRSRLALAVDSANGATVAARP